MYYSRALAISCFGLVASTTNLLYLSNCKIYA